MLCFKVGGGVRNLSQSTIRGVRLAPRSEFVPTYRPPIPWNCGTSR